MREKESVSNVKNHIKFIYLILQYQINRHPQSAIVIAVGIIITQLLSDITLDYVL